MSVWSLGPSKDALFNFRYRRIKLLVELSWPSRGFDLALEFRNDALSQDLAEFYAPLVKRIDLPDGTLSENRDVRKELLVCRACPA